MNMGPILILVALALSALSLVFHARSVGGNPLAGVTAQRLFYLSGIAVTFAVILLFTAFLSHSFQYTYVYNYSSRDLPVAYLIAGFWAGQEGTFLLWVFLLYIYGYVIIRSREQDESVLMSIVTITQIFILILLLIYSPFRFVWESHPEHFARGAIPPDGAGLNPLLQDPWMVLHPPVLFMGYAAATIPFAYAVAALLKNDLTAWVAKSYRWVLYTTTTLGVGIFLGGYWAYKVLGWGGYWGWDPVENSSLIPWLVLVALLHGMTVQRRKGALVRTNLSLALLSFILVFYSTFLTRSGVLADFSVHSFGDLGLSRHLIFFMLFYVIIAAFLMVKRFPAAKGKPLSPGGFAWDTLVCYGIMSLGFFALLVLIGTSMPILSGVFGGRPFSVKTSFYTNLSIPLGALILVLMGAAGYAQFKQKPEFRFLAVVMGAALFMGTVFNLNHTAHPVAYVFSFLALAVIITGIIDLLRFSAPAVLASRMAHLGVAVMVLGFITSSLHSTTEQKKLVMNRAESLRFITLTFKGATDTEKSSLRYLLQRGRSMDNIETPYYIDLRTRSLYREPYISYGFFHDVYISPVEYRSGLMDLSRVDLSKNEEGEIQGMKVLFKGFEIDRAHMASVEPRLYANVDITLNGTTYAVKPGIVFSGEGRKNLDAKIPATGRRVSMASFDVDNGRIALFVEPLKSAQVPPDTVLVEVSFKRLIWFVWLGTLLVTAGGFAAFRLRRGRK